MKEVLEELEIRRGRAREGGGPKRIELGWRKSCTGFRNVPDAR